MRQSKRQETKPPPVPDEVLDEVEQAITDLALETSAAYRTQRHYVYILIDDNRLCRLEYLGKERGWALDMFQGEGR